MRAGRVLAVDHGTSGIKAALVTFRGEVGAFEHRPTPTRFLAGGGAEQDPEHWWRALAGACRALREREPDAFAEVAAICVSSTFSTTVAVGEDGRHLGPALTWMDSRAAPYVRSLVGGLPRVAGYGLRRMLRWIRSTGGGPALSGKDDLAHVLLWREEQPEIYRRACAFLPSKDYLNARLTGRIAASFDSIHLFWLTDIRDPRRIGYDRRLIRLAAIEPAKLPPLRASTDELGPLTHEAASELGLRADTPVFAGSPDHQAALLGSGAVADFEGHLYVGTSSWIECLVPFKRTDPLHSIASFPSAIAGRYQCVNEQDMAGGCLDFLASTLLASGEGGSADAERPYARIDRLAAAAEPGSGGIVFTPWLNGERTPVDDETLRGGLQGLSTATRPEHVARAVLEGVALNTRWSLGHVERFLGRRLEPIRVVGGGGRSELWCQILADVLGRELHVVRDPIAANARGAAFLAALGLGELRLEDLRSLVPVERIHRPTPELRALYDDLFARFLDIHRSERRRVRRAHRRLAARVAPAAGVTARRGSPSSHGRTRP